MNILLIEDSEDDADYINELLMRLPNIKKKAVVATTLTDACKALSDSDFSCIILDINLPDSSGIETLTEIQKFSGFIPIVILTGQEDNALANEAVRHGAQDYLFKYNLNLDMIRRSICYAIERQSTQEQLRYYRSIIEWSEDAIVGKTEEGIVTTWNKGAKRLYGYEASEIIGQSISLLMPDESKDELEIILSTIRRGVTVERLETQRKRKNGELVDVSLTISPILDLRGKVVGAASIARDITQQKQFEEHLVRSNEELEIKVTERTKELISLNNELTAARDEAQAASKLKSEFVANVSHEIRTPMNAIIGMTNVLQKTNLNESQLAYSETIQASAHALLRIINDILDFSKIEAGKLELECIEFDLVKEVESTSAMLASQARIKGLSFMTYVDPSLPKLLRGDATRLRQILINFLANAIKFSNRGEVLLRVSPKKRQGNIINIFFEVIDSGIGLSEDDQMRLFQPFTQSDGSSTRKYGGTGLGLSICKKLVDLMGGEIGVTSIKSSGSTFWCTLPLEISAESSDVTETSELQSLRSLVISDSQEASKILQSYLSSVGMNVDAVFDARQGLQKLRQAYVANEPFSLAIIDLASDAGGGFVLAREIHRDNSLSSTKVAMLTKFDCLGTALDDVDSGVSAFFSKPLKQKELFKRLVQIVKGETNLKSKDLVEANRASRSHEKFVGNGRILVAEDNPLNQEVFRLYLKELNLPCDIVNNGRDAVISVTNQSYSMILMDCQMPELDGFKATEEIRRREAFTSRHIPIVAVTASAMKGDRELCLSSGMDDYISKPIDPAELTLVLRKWMPQIDLPHSIRNARSSLCENQQRAARPVDISQLHARFKGNDAERILNLFVESIPGEIEKLRQAADNENLVEVSKLAHSLRGACGLTYASGMHSICQKIEESAKIKELEIIRKRIEELQNEFYGVREYVAAELA